MSDWNPLTAIRPPLPRLKRKAKRKGKITRTVGGTMDTSSRIGERAIRFAKGPGREMAERAGRVSSKALDRTISWMKDSRKSMKDVPTDRLARAGDTGVSVFLTAKARLTNAMAGAAEGARQRWRDTSKRVDTDAAQKSARRLAQDASKRFDQTAKTLRPQADRARKALSVRSSQVATEMRRRTAEAASRLDGRNVRK